MSEDKALIGITTIENSSSKNRYRAFRYAKSFDSTIKILETLSQKYGCSDARIIRICLNWVLKNDERLKAFEADLDRQELYI